MNLRQRRLWTLLAAFALTAPVAAWSEPTPDELLVNRRRFEQLRKQPEQLAKLRDEAKAFFDLPEARRNQIAKVDASLHEQPAAVQKRLADVLDRYGEWLARLDDATRKQIAAAPNKAARLALIEQIRDQQWIREQPQALRTELQKLTGEALKKRMAEVKSEAKQRHVEWTMAKVFWNELENKRTLPVKLVDMPKEVQLYVNQYLVLFLSDAEKERLSKVEGQWPHYPMALVELADKHPPALPGPFGPKSMAELPLDVRALIVRNLAVKKKELLRLQEGKWPDFGGRLAKLGHSLGTAFPHEFLAYSPDCFQPPMQEFYNKKLKPALTSDEKVRLSEVVAAGKWPDFPRAIQELAEAHSLRPPWFTLPRNDYLDRHRVK